MPETSHSRSPKLSKGAIIQLVEDLVIPIPSIVPFQYNPEKVHRTVEPFDPIGTSDQGRGERDPIVQPFDPRQSISMTIELDASDQLEDDDAIAKLVGVGDRIAALEQLLFAGQSPVGALLNAASALLGGSEPPVKPAVGITLLVFGIGRILPIRITSYSIEEIQFLPSLQPLMATVQLAMQVVTPDQFKRQTSLSIEIAKAAYNLFRVEQSALAIVQTAKNANQLLSILPF